MKFNCKFRNNIGLTTRIDRSRWLPIVALHVQEDRAGNGLVAKRCNDIFYVLLGNICGRCAAGYQIERFDGAPFLFRLELGRTPQDSVGVRTKRSGG
jgi:hypothetical protein